MAVYLLPFTGTGVRSDRFRPDGIDQIPGVPWSMIDLRADCTVATGRCIVSTSGVIDVSGIGNGRQLGANLDAPIGNVVLTFLRNQLGLTSTDLPETTPRGILRRLLLFLGREDGTRWRPCRSNRVANFDIFEAWLGGELVFRDIAPVVQGGAVYTETFTGGDQDALAGTNTWTEVVGDWDRVSNAAALMSSGGATDYWARCEADAVTTDQYCKAAVNAGTDSGGVTVRGASGATTYYGITITTGNISNIVKHVAAAETLLTTISSVTYSNGQILEARIIGSNIRVYYNGTFRGIFTDTAISTGTRGGITGYETASPTVSIDTWEFGDLTFPAPYWVSSQAQVAKTTATTTTVAIPSEGQVTGRLILVHFTGKTSSGTVSPPAGEGWTVIKTTNGGSGYYDVVIAKVWGLAGQTDNTTTGNFTATNAPTSSGWGYTVTVVGNPLQSTNPWTSVAAAYEDTQGTNHSANTTMSGTAVTVKGAHRTILSFFGSADDNTHGSQSVGFLAYGGASYNQTASTTDYSQSLAVSEDVSSDPGITMTQGANGADLYDDIRIVLVVPYLQPLRPPIFNPMQRAAVM